MKSLLFVLFSLLTFKSFSCDDYNINHVGNLQEPLLQETSGIAVSRNYKDIIWAHNDSGDGARFFALTKSGEAKGEYSIKGATHNDWEDMAIGKCPSYMKMGNKTCLFIGDIGDNPFKRKNLTIYIVEEPAPLSENEKVELELLQKYTVNLNTKARNFEAMIVDGDDLILISKSDARAGKQYKEEGESHLYKFKMGKKKKVKAKKFSSFNFFDLKGFKNKDPKKKWQNHLGWLTGADYLHESKKLVLLTYGLIVEFDVSSWNNIKPGTPYVLPNIPQAESVAYLNNGGMIIVSEYGHQPLFEIKCQK